jgi:hypothetical protein
MTTLDEMKTSFFEDTHLLIPFVYCQEDFEANCNVTFTPDEWAEMCRQLEQEALRQYAQGFHQFAIDYVNNNFWSNKISERKVTVSLTYEYDLADPAIRRDYAEWLDDHEDTPQARKDFFIDRAIGKEQLDKTDRSALKLVVGEDK